MHKHIILKYKTEIMTSTVLFLFAVIIAIVASQAEKLDFSPYIAPIEDGSEQADQLAAAQADPGISFSLDQYFYTDTATLELSRSDSDIVAIYYTLDATPPDGGNGLLYEQPIPLICPDQDQVASFVVKACGQRADGSFTTAITHSYFVGEKVYERFDTLVFSLTTDPDNLYDYDRGIFATGRVRDEYNDEMRKKYAEEGIIWEGSQETETPANYQMRGIEWERPVYVEVVDYNGEPLIAQDAGMRVFGNSSRHFRQKSIKLYARSEYDPVNNFFDYDFFPDDATNYGLSVTRYKRLVLRNSGNDRGATYLRDEVIQACADETDLTDVQHSRAAAVFLNGEYYGFVWVKQVYLDQYFNYQNQVRDESWAILTAGEVPIDLPPEDELQAKAISDFNQIYTYAEKDLTDDAVFHELCRLVDIDNFLTYYAVQIYIGNTDWPKGNKKVYRYYGENPVADGSSTADGRWRWLIYDTDYGLLNNGTVGPATKTLGVLLGKAEESEYIYSLTASPLLAAVLSRDDMKEQFVRVMCDLMNDQFSLANITDKISVKSAEYYKELNYQFNYNSASGSWGNVSRSLNQIYSFARMRPAEMRSQIEEFLDIAPVGYTVTCNWNEEAGIKINSCQLDKDFTGFYYDMNTVTFTMETPPGYGLSYWLVNGEPMYGQEITLTKDHAINGNIDVELVRERLDEEAPIITAIAYEESADYIVIENPYQSSLDLRQLYISDDPQNPHKQVLADYILPPGESLKLYCDNYQELDALGGFLIGFNLKNGETLAISDQEGNAVQAVYLPKINNDHILIRDWISGRYYDVAL